MPKRDATSIRRSKRLSLVPLRISRVPGVVTVTADITRLLEQWDSAKVATLIALCSWVHRIAALDSAQRRLHALGAEAEASSVLVMCIAAIAEGHAFFSEDGLEKHFAEEFRRHPALQHQYKSVREALERKPADTNKSRWLRDKFGFHMNEVKLVKRGLERWKADQGACGPMQLFRVCADTEPHFTAEGCNGVYMAGLFGLKGGASLVDELGNAVGELGGQASVGHRKIVGFVEALVLAIEADQEKEIAKMAERSR